MTASLPPDSGPGIRKAPVLSPGLRATAYFLFILPIAGLLAHGVIYIVGLSSPEFLHDYCYFPLLASGDRVFVTPLRIVAGVSFVCLVSTWLHYRRTRMGLDIASRIAAYLWVISIILLLRAAYAAQLQP